MHDQTEQYYWDLIASKLSDNISIEDDVILSEWLDNSKVNRRVFSEANELWQATKNESKVRAFLNIENEWQLFQQSIERQSEKAKPNNVRKSSPWTVVLAIAACISLILVTLTSLWQHSELNWISYQSQDSVMTIILPDSSVVWLNQDSELKVSKNFTNRRVGIKGEAYFQIKRNEKSPFVVETSHAFIKVLGTSFNVNVKDTISVVSVLNGKVQIEDSDSHKQDLIALEQGTVNANFIYKENLSSTTFLDWRLVNNPQYDAEVNNMLTYLTVDYTWKKNNLNNSVIEGSLRNNAMLAEYDSILLEIQFSRPNGKIVKTNLLLTENLKPGTSLSFSRRLFDIFSKTEDVKVKIISATVRN